MFSRIQASSVARLSRGFGLWNSVPTTPADPILGLNERFKNSTDPRKVNIVVGAYRDENGKPWVLPSVKEAVKITTANTKDMEYIPIIGDKDFIHLAMQIAYGKEAKPLLENRIAGVQTLSGCGGCYMGATFLKRFWPNKDLTIYTTDPTWPIHNTLLATTGIKNLQLPYYNPTTKGLDFEKMCDALEKAPEQSVIMLHSCAHNPTGVDPTPEQWKQIAQIFARRKHFAFFDMAYQGFATGDLEADNLSIKIWNSLGLEFCVAQSFAKSMGMYGHRLGTFSVVCQNSAEAAQVNSQLATISRNTWSSPPRFGSDVAKTLMTDPKLYNMWLQDMQVMSDRIKGMRISLVDNLKKLGNPHDWSHINRQIGMFAFTGLRKEHCEELIDKHAVFLTMNGRIALVGLNPKNVEYVSKAFDAVTRNSKF